MKKKNSEKICPRCGKNYCGFPAISRRDNKTEICSDCGTQEAMFDFQINSCSKPLPNIVKMEREWLNKKKKGA
jgi:ribosomal protein L40E